MKTSTTFWNYFTYNHKAIANLPYEPTKSQTNINRWLDRHIKNYCHHLDYIIRFPKSKGEKPEIIITANGNALYFNYVLNLVKAAPKIPNWKVTAFIQPSTERDQMIDGLDKPYIFCDLVLKTSELKFQPLEPTAANRKLDVIVFLKDYSIYCNSKILLEAVFIIMQDLLGEKSFHDNLNFVQLGQMPEEEGHLIQLYDLQVYIDEINKRNNKTKNNKCN